MPKLKSIYSGWISALRCLRENPLYEYWGRAPALGPNAQRQIAALLLLGFAALMVGCALTVIHSQGQAGLAPLLIAGLLAIGVPSLALVHSVSRDALCLLSEQYSAKRQVCYDDLLATTALSEQEVVVGTAFALVKRFWPLALTAALLLTLIAVLSALAGPNPGRGFQDNSVGVVLFFAPLQVIFRFGSAMLAGLCLTLWLMSLGGGRHSAALVQIGSGAAVLLFVLQTAIVFRLQDLDNPYGLGLLDADALGLRIVGGNIICLPLLACLGLYLARRIEWLRFLLGGLLALELLGTFVLFGLPGVFSPYSFDYVMLAQPIEALWSFGALALLNVQGCLQGDSQYSYFWFATPWRAWLLLLYQLIFVVMLAEFARDAIRRRKWGSAGP